MTDIDKLISDLGRAVMTRDERTEQIHRAGEHARNICREVRALAQCYVGAGKVVIPHPELEELRAIIRKLKDLAYQ